MKTKQEIEKIADAYIDNMDSRSFWDSFISGYETCQKDYEAKVNELLSALEQIATAPHPFNDFEHEVFVWVATDIARKALSFYNAT